MTNSTYNPVFLPENIPAELRALDRWLPWYAYQDKNGKWQKAPSKSTSEPEKWGPFADSVGRALKGKNKGMGLVMTGYRDLTVIDLDKVIDEQGHVAEWALKIVNALDTYVEVSPSGRGLRLPVWGQIPSDVVNNAIGAEFYNGHASRFLTWTGDEHPILSSGRVAELEAWELIELWEQYKVTPSSSGVAGVAGAAGGVEAAPDLLEEWELPDWRELGISKASEAFLERGESGGDGSSTLAGVARDLVAVGLSDAEVFSLLAMNDHAMSVCMRHRRNDEDRALEYLWKWHCCKGRERAVMVATADDFDDLSGEDGALLRDLQRAENQRIRDEPTVIDTAGFVGPDQARERFVYLTMHNAVFDRLHPRAILKMEGFRNTFAASKIRVGQGRPRPVTDVWLEDRRRFTTETVTFRPGAGEITRCPLNNAAMNTWVPPSREGNVMDIQPFLDHIDYLFLDRAGDFLDWLAHIEQFPGELPHKCWLHISPSTGTGRNWLASVLCRVWPGFVAPNMELSGLIGGGFNGVLSECLLTIIDEIREGGSNTNQWANAEKFKQAINPEYRQINRKYGIQNMEWNCARWLIFSNHTQALPIDDDDRRVEVVINDEGPKDAAYYTRLYTLLNDPAFILGVAKFLGARDISKFNPGARARKTADKARVVAATKSDTQCKVEDLISSWPCDVITAGALASELGGDLRGLIPVLHRAGCESAVARPRMGADGKTQRIWVLRNVSRWRNAEGIELRQTIEKAGAEDF